jgi:hypothetical protein
MRLPLIAHADLSPEQRPVYEDMRAGIEQNFQGFKTIAENGALMGPWNPWLHDPKFGKPIWELTKALSFSPSLPKPVREVAILVTGAKIPCGLRDLCPRNCSRAARTCRRQARHHRRRPASDGPRARRGDRL